MKTITCDVCKKVLSNEYIVIGSETETDLYFENRLPTKVGETQYIGRYHDLHFCSKDHFIKYFFDRSDLTTE